MTRKARIVLVVASAVAASGLFVSGFAVAAGVHNDEPTVSDARAVVRHASPPTDRAQAKVSASGAMTRVRGFAAISHTSMGTYCLKLPSSIRSTSYVPVATIDYSGASGNATVQWRSSSFACPTTRWVEIRTYSPAGALDDNAFSVVVP